MLDLIIRSMINYISLTSNYFDNGEYADVAELADALDSGTSAKVDRNFSEPAPLYGFTEDLVSSSLLSFSPFSERHLREKICGHGGIGRRAGFRCQW